MNLPSTMQALCLTEGGYSTQAVLGMNPDDFSKFLELKEIPLPEVKSGQVLIKVISAMVNPSDQMFIQGGYGQPRVKDTPAGFEGVGIVVDGKGFLAKRLKGKRVSFVIGQKDSGAWAEYATASAATVIKLRKDVRDEDAAGLIVNPLTAAAMVDLVPDGGAFVVSAAASQLGKLMAGVAKENGKRMIGLVRRDEVFDPLKSLGAVHVLNENDEDFLKNLHALFKKERPTVFLDAVAGSVSARVFNAMGKDSRWVVYGKLAPEPPEIIEPGKLIFMRKRIEGFWLVTWLRQASILRKLKTIKQVQARFADGRWRTDVGEKIELRNVISQLPSALAKTDAKVMIVCS